MILAGPNHRRQWRLGLTLKGDHGYENRKYVSWPLGKERGPIGGVVAFSAAAFAEISGEERTGKGLTMHAFENMDHEHFMTEALNEARQAFDRGDRPIGAVIVCGGETIARASNSFATDRSHLAHAELKAVLSCASDLRVRGRECVIYTTVEPCYMCLGAIVMGNIRNIVFGMPDAIVGGRTMLETVPHVRQRIANYVGGVLEAQCIDLYRRYDGPEAERCLGRES